jgi:hypothetical protein
MPSLLSGLKGPFLIHRNRPRRKPGKSRRLLSMRPEKRPQTIMEQYHYREMMRQPYNSKTFLTPIDAWYLAKDWPLAGLRTDL